MYFHKILYTKSEILNTIYNVLYVVCYIKKYIYIIYHRRKFRSQTPDNMDRWRSRGGKSQWREEQKREDQRRERVRRKKMQVREKVGKSRNIVFPNDLWLRRVEN